MNGITFLLQWIVLIVWTKSLKKLQDEWNLDGYIENGITYVKFRATNIS